LTTDALSPIEAFSVVRSRCRALHEVLVPDLIWEKFREWHCRQEDVTCHHSVALLAHQRGCLNRVTLPIHRYLLPTGAISSRITKQYIQDVQEKWMFCDEPRERHKRWRIFQQHLAELRRAAWLEEMSYSIVGLEAVREGPDIEAISGSGVQVAFEVKFIGTQDSDFAMVIESLAGQPSFGPVSPYAAINYVVFRAYEAAQQLQASGIRRIVVLIIDDTAWWRFGIQLKKQWINWRQPRFFDVDPAWAVFISRQNKRYPGLPDDLAPTLRKIDSLWIVSQSSDFKLQLNYDFPTNDREL
jgi:hypothetical protein